MSDEQLLQKQRKQLTELNENASIYGEQQLTQDELEAYLQSQNTLLDKNSPVHEIRSRIVRMMMVDTETAQSMQENFADLVFEAQTQRETLETQANATGMEKVKNAFTGKSKGAANREMDTLKSERKTLVAEKRFVQLNAAAEKRKEELLRKLESGEGNEQRIRDRIGLLNWILEDNSRENLVDKMFALEKSSDYSLEVIDTMDRFFEVDAMTSLNQISGQVYKKPYDQNMFFRDTARFVSDYNKAPKAKLNVMLNAADAILIMRDNRHADCRFHEDTTKNPPVLVADAASADDQDSAFSLLNTIMEAKYRDMKAFELKNQDALNGRLNLNGILDHFYELSEGFKCMQQAYAVLKDMGESDAYTRLEPENKITFMERKNYLQAMALTLQDLIQWAKQKANAPLTDALLEIYPEVTLQQRLDSLVNSQN